MGQAVVVGDVFHDDIIGDDELFQASAERFAEGGIGLDPKRIGGGADPAVGLQPAFGGDDGGANGLAGLEFFEVLGDLAVEKAGAIRAGEFEDLPKYRGGG